MPSVSVIVPCYNYGRFVTDCVTSLLTNTKVELDILVIDDRSTDDSWSVVRTLPALHPGIRVTRNERNLGLIGTANLGLDQAKGDYVVLLSADDAHAPGWLDRAAIGLEGHPSASLTYGPTRRFSGALPTVHRHRDERVVLHPGRRWLEETCRRGVPAILSPEVVVRTSAQREVGGYNPALPYSSDMEMWLRLASIGDVLRMSGPIAAFYRVSGQSMSREIYLDPLRELRVRRAAFDGWHAAAEGRVADRDDLMRVARTSLARQAVRRAGWAFLRDADLFEAVCEFALEQDAEWAGPAVGRLRTLSGSRLAARTRERLSPVTSLSAKARQAATDLRARLHIV